MKFHANDAVTFLCHIRIVFCLCYSMFFWISEGIQIEREVFLWYVPFIKTAITAIGVQRMVQKG